MNAELLENGAASELIEDLVAELASVVKRLEAANKDYWGLMDAFSRLTRTCQDLQQHNAQLHDELKEAYDAAHPMTLVERGKHKALQTMYNAALEEIKRLKS
jgi:ketopantoate reductase